MGFDPYVRWLGIRDPHRPLNHYQLLGLPMFESNLQVIAAAAERRMQEVRAHQSGPHAETAQRIFKELSVARKCLLDPEKRAAYDARLRAAAAPSDSPSDSSSAQPLNPLPTAKPLTVPKATRVTAGNSPAKPLPVARPIRKTAKSPQPAAARSRPVRAAVAAAGTESADGETIGGRRWMDVLSAVRIPPMLRSAILAAALIVVAGVAVAVTILNLPPSLWQSERRTAAADERSFKPVLVDGPPAAGPDTTESVEEDESSDDAAAGEDGGAAADVSSPTDGGANVSAKSSGKTAEPAPWEIPPPKRPEPIRSTPKWTLSRDVYKQLAAARAAMRNRNLAEARRRILEAERWTRGADDRREIERTANCLRRLEEFWTAVRSGLDEMSAGREIVYRGTPVKVAGVAENVIALQDAARRQKVFSTDPLLVNRDVAIALAGVRPEQLADRSDLAIAAFDAFDEQGVLAYVPDSCAKAQSQGHNTDYLMAEAVYDFALAKLDETGGLGDLADASSGEERGEGIEAGAREKQPQPDDAALAKADKDIEELFAEELRLRDPQRRAKFAKDLLRHAQETKEDAPRFALLQQAGKVAGMAGDVKTAVEALTQLLTEFEVKSIDPLTDVTDDLSRKPLPPEFSELVLELTLKVAQAGAVNDEFRLAGKALTHGQLALRSAKSPELYRLLQTAREEIAFLEREYRVVERARTTLEKEPDDEEANTTVGEYLCLSKGKFADSLPFLEKGDNHELLDLVKLEVEKPTDANQRVKLADGWWEFAQQAEKKPVSRWACLRAGYWYGLALPQLVGMNKARAQKRLTDAEMVATAAGMIRWDEALDRLIVGTWKITWKDVRTGETTVEYLTFRSEQTVLRSSTLLGNWGVEAKEVVVRHGSYTDHFRAVDRNQIMAVRLLRGVPYMQGVGARYESGRVIRAS